jgi:hypothetical protein
MLGLREKATSRLLAGGLTATLLTAASQPLGVANPHSLVIPACAGLAGLAASIISSVLATKVSESLNAANAERNHHVRLAIALALRDALTELRTDLKFREEHFHEAVPHALPNFFDIWLSQLNLALHPNSEAAIVEALFPLTITEEQWQTVSRYDSHYDATWLAKLSVETRRHYTSTQEQDAAALADLLRDQLTFPDNAAPSALVNFWQALNAAPPVRDY